MVFYRKYRPQQICELDLVTVRDKLISILKSGNIPHAFLFAGPKGLGKTSAARILAKAINCERRSKLPTSSTQKAGLRGAGKISKLEEAKDKRPDLPVGRLTTDDQIEPCNKCDACISITKGSNLDVIEIDAASNRGIEEIRDLREKIKFSPVSLAKKIYIIDEVHMLTIEAFNALLKTLEEPPSHAVFILCTTEAWKLPETIISRVFYVKFEKPSLEEIKRSIGRVLAGEKIELDESLYDKIYSSSSGSFRDATKIIEELSVLSPGKKISREMFEALYKSDSIDGKVLELIKNLSEKNVKGALIVIDSLAANGTDFKTVTEKIVGFLRKLLLKKSGFGKEVLEPVDLDITSINSLIFEFSTAYKDLKFAVLPQLPLELVVVKWCLTNQIQNEEFRIQNSEKKEKEKKEESKTSVNKDIEEKPSEKNLDLPKKSQAVKQSDLGEFLKKLIEAVKADNHSIAGVLRGCRLVGINDGEIKLETAFKFHKDKLSESKTRKIIEKRAGEILGKEISLEVTMKVK